MLQIIMKILKKWWFWIVIIIILAITYFVFFYPSYCTSGLTPDGGPAGKFCHTIWQERFGSYGMP